jgi:hypothetical protein
MSKNKFKLFAAACVLSLTAIVLSSAPVFVSKAESDDILREIAGYKNWKRINEVPIKVSGGFQIDGVAAETITFIIDGQEVTNFRTGDLGG